jgi:hypothetical protein
MPYPFMALGAAGTVSAQRTFGVSGEDESPLTVLSLGALLAAVAATTATGQL